ncbi:hypothetical protein [Streptomyces racemochromogenes]|uniref:hypothetical protein n=1 Tax=Streptomyces racemochromogenes TaxID=67353 RepID=UPI0031EAB17A
MNPDTAWLCLVLAACLLFAWAWYGATRDKRRWQRSTRTPSQVARDLAAAKAARTRAERQIFDQIIAAEFPAGIPHQTRRTEEDQ